MDMPIGEILKYGSFFGFLVAVIGLVWKVFTDLINKNEASKNRLLDKQHSKNLELQREKAELQKQLEAEKKRYVENMINEVKQQISGLYEKFNEVNGRYIKLATQHESNENQREGLLKEVDNYFNMTKINIAALEKKVDGNHQQFQSKVIEISNDLLLIKEVAKKVKKESS